MSASPARSQAGGAAPLRVCVMFTRLGPYHLARLDAARRRFEHAGGRLVALEMARRNASHYWEHHAPPQGLTVDTLSDDDYANASARDRWHLSHAALERHQPDTVAINGWAAPESHAALHWCRRRGRAAVLMSTGLAPDAPPARLRELAKGAIVRRFDAALVGGQRHRSYLESLGMPAARIFDGYNVVDNAHFRAGAERAVKEEPALRATLGLPGPYFLTPCRLIPEKNLGTLVDAYARYQGLAGPQAWPLVIAGEGPGRDALAARVAASGCAASVHLLGFQSYERMPALYALAGALVLPSVSETWGLVVNEAFACGIPAIVSTRCGAVDDLVHEGVTGHRFDPLDVGVLAATLAHFAQRPAAERTTMGRAARDAIDAWPVERFAAGLDAAVRAARASAAPALDPIRASLLRMTLHALNRAPGRAREKRRPGPCASRS